MTTAVIATVVAMALVLALCVGGVARLAREARADLDSGRGGDEVLDRRLAAARSALRQLARYRDKALRALARRARARG